MTNYNSSEAAKLNTYSNKLVTEEYSSIKLAEAILKTREPRIRTFDGDVKNYPAFKASFNKLERENTYPEDELLEILLTHVTDEVEKALQGILPRSGKYKN